MSQVKMHSLSSYGAEMENEELWKQLNFSLRSPNCIVLLHVVMDRYLNILRTIEIFLICVSLGSYGKAGGYPLSPPPVGF